MLEIARRILAEAGRPLSARKIVELAAQAGKSLDLGALREALISEPGVHEVRRGVFELVTDSAPQAAAPQAAPKAAPKAAPPAPAAAAVTAAADEDDADGDDRKRRRRRPKAKELLGDEPVAALSVEAAVAQAEAATDTESLRRSLWTQVRDRAAAAVTDEALPPVPPVTPAAEPSEGEGEGRRSRRARQEGRGRRAERVAEAPEAPAAPPPEVQAPPPRVETPARAPRAEAPRAAAPQENVNQNKSLRSALRDRLKAWAAALPKVVKIAPAPPKPLSPTPRKVADNPAADILARLAARRRVRPAQAVVPPAEALTPVVAAPVAPTPVVAAPVAPTPVAPTPGAPTPVAPTPVAAAPVASVTPPPVAEPAPAPAAAETRPPRPAEEGLAAQVRGQLLAEDRTSTMRRLAERLGEEPGAVRAAVVADNARRSAAGQRALFVLLPDGTVGLSEWTLSERYLDLEEKIQYALAEQEEMVRRDLLDRVANLSDAAFEHVVTLLLERLGHDDVRTVHRQGSTLALLTRRDGEPVAIVARRARSVVGAETVQALEATLPRFHADRGLLITVGEFDDKARVAARKASVQLLDGAAFARALYTHDIGVSRHQPTFRYPDAAFFAGLG